MEILEGASKHESPVFGYREFFLYPGDKMLYGGFGRAWPSAEMEAKCLCHIGPATDVVPIDHPSHRCGIYLLRQPSGPLCPGYIGAWCVGWGKVVEYEEGWRVQHCRIERLVLPPGPSYGVPIEVAERLVLPPGTSTIIPLLSHYGVPIEVAPERYRVLDVPPST
jgi:hypothetical protein